MSLLSEKQQKLFSFFFVKNHFSELHLCLNYYNQSIEFPLTNNQEVGMGKLFELFAHNLVARD